MECIEAIMIRGQESFQLLNLINTIQITIDDNRIVNLLKKTHKSLLYIYVNGDIIGILFSASVKNDTEQIFVMCREK